MENVKEFLENSSIIGLSLISNSNRFVRLFWILVVIGGFAWAIHMIFESFEDWRQKPILTTIETLPISEITFPNVTVCPPRNLFLNLNYDILKSTNMNLNSKSRNELIDYSLDVIQEELYKEVMANLSKLEDPDRFYNWYHGYTTIKYPFYDVFTKSGEELGRLVYMVHTSATSGNISTQHFGNPFDANKKDDNIYVEIKVFVPISVWGNRSIAMFVYIDKNDTTMLSMPNFDELKEPDRSDWSKNISVKYLESEIFSYETYSYEIKDYVFTIANLLEDEKLPAFRFSWNYNKHLVPDDITKHSGYQTGWTTEFRR